MFTSMTPLIPAGLDAIGSYLVKANAAGLLLQGITAFTLRDAADRGRLGGSTFKLLNLALAATVAQQVHGCCGLGALVVAFMCVQELSL